MIKSYNRQTPHPDRHTPLVTVCVPNYEYADYIDECIESLLASDYPNIEINICDNASTDSSWKHITAWAAANPDVITCARHRQNFGTDANYATAGNQNIRGKYVMYFASDDVVYPDFIRRAVELMQSDEHIGYVMGHRTIMLAGGETEEEPPFYRESAVIPGTEQCAVYMMAAVNPSASQCIYRHDVTKGRSSIGGVASTWYGARLMDFRICLEYDMGYFHTPCIYHRIHERAQSQLASKDLLEVVGPYVLVLQFAELAERCGLRKAAARKPEALKKLASLALRYAEKHKDNAELAAKYIMLARAIHSGQIEEIGETRRVSYDLPPGSRRVTI